MKPFSKCPVCGGATIGKEVEKLLRGGVNFAAVTVRAEVCLHCGERLYSKDTVEDFEQVRAKLRSREVAGFEPLGQSFQVTGATALASVRAECAMSETEARSFLHLYLFSGDDPLQPIAELSFGERARLSLALLVARGATVLLLDEPLNHLDLDSRERFESALHAFNGAVVAASHDRYFVERFASTVWEIRPDGSGRRTFAVAS